MNENAENKGQAIRGKPRFPQRSFLSEEFRKNAFLYTALLLTTIALLLRLYRLGTYELWLDEAYTYRQAVIVD